MTPLYQPISRPAHRLARLGIALDRRNGLDRLRQIGRMSELANIDAVWADARTAPDEGVDPLEALAAVAELTRTLTLGVILDADHGPTPEAVARAFPDRASGRLRLGVRLADVSAEQCEHAARVADDALLSRAAQIDAAVQALRTACSSVARDPRSLGIVLEVPVSIGRTNAEAVARAAAEPLFDDQRIGQPADLGLFGTLEQCQERVVELAHAGVTELLCWLPNSTDLPDVIAQLTATVIGGLDVLRPSAPRSRDPDPPPTWGGRSRFPRSP